MSNNLGQKLRKAREARGLTLRDLQEITSLDFSVISKIERGEITKPKFHDVINLATSLQIKLDALEKCVTSHAKLPTARGVELHPLGGKILGASLDAVLRKRRVAGGLSLRGLGKLTGLNFINLARIERGVIQKPAFRDVVIIARVLKMKISGLAKTVQNKRKQKKRLIIAE